MTATRTGPVISAGRSAAYAPLGPRLRFANWVPEYNRTIIPELLGFTTTCEPTRLTAGALIDIRLSEILLPHLATTDSALSARFAEN